jgi:ATPase family AAA domain-containing protein 3A/B
MLRTAVERFGAHVAMGAGAAGAVAVSAPTARCAKDDAKAITPSFDPEALERGAKALREINKSAYAKNVRAHPHLTTRPPRSRARSRDRRLNNLRFRHLENRADE